MHRHLKWTVGMLVLVAVGVFAAVGLAAGTKSASTHASKVTIKVTASEWKFKLSKSSVPVGTTVVFQVKNAGKIGHNFVIAGHKTRLLAPGKSQSIMVKFTKKGTYAYDSSVSGHARLGMKGVFGVGVTAPPPTTTVTTTTTTGNVGTATTTVNVNMFEYGFTLSQSSIPSGTVTFVIKNTGAEVHNFDINGVHSGALIGAGATETWTVKLAPGQYLYTCDVPFHVDKGMTGSFQVTP